MQEIKQPKLSGLAALTGMLAKFTLVAAIFLIGACTSYQGRTDGYRVSPSVMLEDARVQLRTMLYQSSLGEKMSEDLTQAHAVIILPTYGAGGFGMIGGAGGKGVMLVKGANQQWSYPAYVNTGGVKLGMLLGGYKGSVVFIVKTPEDVNALLDNRFHFDMDAAAAIGNAGRYTAVILASPVSKSISGYGLLFGAYLGASFEFAGITAADDLSQAFYRDDNAKLLAILRSGEFSNPAADLLRAELAKFSAVN